MYKFLVIILIILFFISCKSQSIENKPISNPDDFSNKSYNQEFNTYLNSLANEKQLKYVKVLYKKKVFDFKEFKQKIGFNENLEISIIKDSIAISEHKIKGCNILFIVK